MKTDHLPTLTQAHRTADQTAAVLIDSEYRQVLSVSHTDRVIFVPDMGLLTVEGKGYRVPASLFAAVRTVLSLGPVSA